jgi:transposase-like protein
MEAGGITVSEFFEGITQNPVGRHRQYTKREKEIIIHAYENGYNLSEVAEKLKTSQDTMRKFWRAYKRGEDER